MEGQSMTDYSKLVEALRHVGIHQDCNECEAGRWHNEFDCCLFKDAADAIEALETEIRESMQKCAECGDRCVEVVRCRECKWYSIYEAKKDGTPDKRYSPSVCLREIYAKRRDPDWFCADGERKVQDADT